MTSAALIGAFTVGAAYGYGSQRSAFCLSSGLRSTLDGDWTKVKALALAVAVQLLLLPAVFAAGWATPVLPPFMPIAGMAGGILFGLSMRWAGGCAAGVWYKLGAGDLGGLAAVLGMGLGAAAAETGPLSSLRVAVQSMLGMTPIAAPPLVLPLAGIAVLLLLSRTSDGSSGAWTWRRTGLWIGIVAAAAWPASALAGRRYGLAIIPGTSGLVAGLTARPFPVWDVVLLAGIVAGAWIAARRSGPVRPRAGAPAGLLKRFAGGLGLGVGASVAAGCTVGQGLTGLGLLAPGSVVVMSGIFLGCTLAASAARRGDRRASRMARA